MIVRDELTRSLREHPHILKSDKLSYLLNCEICISVYTSALVTASCMLFPRVSKPILYALALAEIQASLTEFEATRSISDFSDFGVELR